MHLQWKNRTVKQCKGTIVRFGIDWFTQKFSHVHLSFPTRLSHIFRFVVAALTNGDSQRVRERAKIFTTNGNFCPFITNSLQFGVPAYLPCSRTISTSMPVGQGLPCSIFATVGQPKLGFNDVIFGAENENFCGSIKH